MMHFVLNLIFLAAGFAAGALLAWLLLRGRYQTTLSKLEERNILLSENLQQATSRLEKESQLLRETENRHARLEADYNNLHERFQQHKIEVEQMRQMLVEQFKNIAGELLEDKSKKFTEQNKQNIDQILQPLREKLEAFEKKVESSHKDTIDRSSRLMEQLKNLGELNQRLSEEARNLTRALKGDTKTQGTWGEIILESILEKSGLVRDREYFIQQRVVTEDGRTLQPDIIINLPDDKKIIIDSKVSLLDYERFISETDEDQKSRHLQNHVHSIRKHIKTLGEKKYQQIYNNSPDFVLMFVPIEPALALALTHDHALFQEAMERNVVLTGPTTLWATLRTISTMWKQEYQNRNVREIARQAGALYDKFTNLLSDLEEIGKKIKASQEAYSSAMTKLTGRGSLIGRVEKLRELGAENTKVIPQKWLDRSLPDEDAKQNQNELF
ncbi:MAG: DNA recombination protein RmuC [Chitinophagales bacterium]|nr:MAG: DNA recombination protein RmuC [Chitinophagales bacterium]